MYIIIVEYVRTYVRAYVRACVRAWMRACVRSSTTHHRVGENLPVLGQTSWRTDRLVQKCSIRCHSKHQHRDTAARTALSVDAWDTVCGRTRKREPLKDY